MSKRRKDDWLVPAIIASGTVAFFLSKSAFGATKPSKSPVQTATVGDRVYSIARLGQGHYIVSLVSTAGEFEPIPVVYSFNQTEELGSNGPPEKIARLKSDIKSFNVSFS